MYRDSWWARCGNAGSGAITDDMISSATKYSGNVSDVVTRVDGSDLTLDHSGYLGGGSCPQIPPVVVFGSSFQIDSGGNFCTILTWMRGLVMLSAYYACFRIISSSR